MKKVILAALFAICISTAQAQFLVSDFSNVVGDGGGGDGSQGAGIWNFNGINSTTGALLVNIVSGPENIGSGLFLEFTGDLTAADGLTGLGVSFFDGSFTPIGTTINFAKIAGTQTVAIPFTASGVQFAQLTLNGVGTSGSPTTFDNLAVVVPEPSSFALMGLGMGALYLLRRRK